MARGAFKISGYAAAGLVFALVLAPLGAVLWRAGGWGSFAAADWAALRFTVVQALLSAAFSVAIAVPVARALARRQFWGRQALILLMGAPFILPVIVAVLGLIAVFGRSGLVNAVLGALSLPDVSIYGFHGVVLAHVFFNLPLATRLLLQGWEAIPQQRFRLAAQLGMGPQDMRRWLEYPMLREHIPPAFMVIFLICLSSFAVALTLGGGPRATTLELAIFQAFRFEFDLGRAALLSMVQLMLVVFAGLMALRLRQVAAFGAVGGETRQRWDASGVGLKLWDFSVLTMTALFVGLPLIMVILRGIPTLANLPWSVFEAAIVSVLIALASTVLCLVLAFPLAARKGFGEVVGLLGLAISPLVLGTGLFLMINPFLAPSSLAFPVTILVNALMSLPFVVRAIAPDYARAERDFGRLADQLGLIGWARIRYLLWPQMRCALGFAAGLAAALSMGDLGVIALFADPESATLPLQVYRLMGAYRMQDAAGAALLLLILTFGLFALFDLGGRRNA